MGRTTKIQVHEELEDLQRLYKKTTSPKLKLRLKSLIYTKTKKYKTQTILATHLGINYSSLKRWYKQYREEGLDSFLELKSGGNKPSIITPAIHAKLEEKMNDSHNPLRGYWEAQQWVKANFDLDIAYNTLRTYLIRHFKTKIKTPRKSHYKKSEQAVKAFFKTSICIRNH